MLRLVRIVDGRDSIPGCMRANDSPAAVTLKRPSAGLRPLTRFAHTSIVRWTRSTG